MCNLYDIGPAPGSERFPWESSVRKMVENLTYVAPARMGVVVRNLDGRMDPAEMRWGFSRPWANSINNAREDKLDGRMWSESWALRRCVLPVRRFYEWSGPKGGKTKHTISIDPNYWFWIAGIWEEHPRLGPCYSMLTMSANEQMKSIHHRMPAILNPDGIDEYLAEGSVALPDLKLNSAPLSISDPPLPDTLFKVDSLDDD